MRHVTLSAALAAVLLAACSSSSSSSTSAKSSPTALTGIETLSASLADSAAASALNSNSSAPLSFPQASLSGPVATAIKPFVLKGNGNGAADVSWTTPDGTLTVHHSANQVGNNPVGHFTLKGTTCYFTTTFSKGTFNYVPSKSTGTWAKVTQHGTGQYLVTAAGSAPLSKGKTSCTFSNIGAVQSSGAKIVFAAAAPVTVAS